MSQQSELDELTECLVGRLAEDPREAGLTQSQLAARLRGTNRGWQQAVSRFEQGKARPAVFVLHSRLPAGLRQEPRRGHGRA